MRVNDTKRFKDFFKEEVDGELIQTYDEFKRWYTQESHMSDSSTDVPSEKTFYLIAYEYDDCRVAFSDVGFLEHFAIDLYSYYKEFEATTKAIDDLMALKASDIAKDGEVITNVADIPETASSTNVEEVDFITGQNKMINVKGKLQIAKELLSNKRAYTVKQFLSRFKHLFVKILSTEYNYVVED